MTSSLPPEDQPNRSDLVECRRAGLAATPIPLVCGGAVVIAGFDAQLPPSLNAPDTAVTAYYAAHSTALLARSTAWSLSALLLVWFASGIHTWLRHRVPASRAAAIRAGLTSTAVVFVISAAANTAVVLTTRSGSTAAAPLFRCGVLLYPMLAPVIALSVALMPAPRILSARGIPALLLVVVHLAMPVLAMLPGANLALPVLVMIGIIGFLLWVSWTGTALARASHLLLRSAEARAPDSPPRETPERQPPTTPPATRIQDQSQRY